MTYKKEIFDKIENNLKASRFSKNEKDNTFDVDKIFLHRIFGIFILIFIILSTLIISFYLAQVIGTIITYVTNHVGNIISKSIPNKNIKFFLNDYLLMTTESILLCAAQIFSIHFFIYLLKESGYLARGVFLIDKIMNLVGLNKDAFIPLVSNFACNVPGILSAKTIKDKWVKIITIIISPLISCPAKLSIYVMISGIYFTGIKQSLFILSIYVLGIVIGIIISKILNIFIKKSNTSFIIEIPSYKLPNIINAFTTAIQKSFHFIKSTALLIFIFTFIFWTLNNLKVENSENKNENYLHKIGKSIEPVLSPLGFDYKMNIALIGGFFTKESVPIILKTLYNICSDDEKKDTKNKIPITTGIIFLIFTMIYCPCINTLLAIKNELGSVFSMFLVIFYLILAFGTSFLFKIFINIFF